MDNVFFPETNTVFPEIKRTSSFTNKVYFGETVRGMQHMSPVLQKPLVYAASRDITATYYIDAEVNKKNNITLASDVGTDKGFVEFIEKKVYHDKNKDGQHNEYEYGFILKIFISKDGNKITESYKASKVADDELLLFIEHGEDLFSSKKIYAKTGKAVFTYITANDLYSKLKNYITDTKETSSETAEEISPLTVAQLKELLEKGYLESAYDVLKKVLSAISEMVTFIPDLLGKVLIQIGEWIDELVIPEEFWDTTDKKNVIAIDDTILKKIKEYAEKLKIGHTASGIIDKIEEVIRGFIAKYNAYVQAFTEENEFMADQLAQKVAYVCGLWNGLVDFVSGTLNFFGEILSLPGKTTEEKEAVLEQLDNFIDLLLQPDLFDKLQQGFNTFIESIKKELQNEENEPDWVRIHYIAGFAVAFIASFFIPIANVAKIEKLGKTGKLLSEILGGIGAKVAEAGKTLKETVQNSFVTLLKALQEALELIAKGGSRFLDFFRDLAKKIVAWFLRNKKLIQSQYKEISNFTTKELDWMSSRKIGALGGNILKATQIRKLRGILKQKGITLIVEGDSKSITKLFKPVNDFKTIDDLFNAMRYEGFPGGFNASTKQFFLSNKATEIVSFHEMAHLKHFEEIGDIYLTLSRLEKETYVWKQILANKNKWTKAELLDALNYINRVRKAAGIKEPIKIK